MTAKAFIASILGLVAVFTHASHAASPEDANPKSSTLAVVERATARRIAVTILDDVRTLDLAVRQWALENWQPASATPKPTDLAPYFKEGTRLRAELSAGRCNDSLGNPITLRNSDRVPLISRATVQQYAAFLSPVAWGSFYEGVDPSALPGPEPAPANPTTEEELRISAGWLMWEMRKLTAARDQWAIENNIRDDRQPRPEDLHPYFKRGTRLHGELAAGRTIDSLGNPIKLPPMGESPTISPATATRLAPVVPAEFWGPFVTK